MRKIKLSIFLGLYIGISAQDLPTMSALEIKSPQSYAFEKHGNVPVNLYTGTLDLKIPIYSLPTSSGKSLDVFISYDSSGFLPHKKSDYAGVSWSLLAGGRITRSVNRIADEYLGNPTSNLGNPFGPGADLNGFLTGVRLNPYQNSQVYDLYGVAGGLNGLDWRLGTAQNGYEGEPDTFHFNAMGLSGKFMVGNNGTVLVESNDPNVKVDLSGLVSYGGKQFCKPPNETIVITDGQGNKYYFGGDFSKYEIGYLLKSPGLHKDNRFEGFPYINSFSLAKIEFTNGQIVTFDYAADTLNNIFCNLTTSSINLKANAKVLNFEGYFQDGTSYGEWQNCPGGIGCEYVSNNSPSNTENFILTKRSLLESIKYEGNEIKINYKDTGYPIKHYEGVSNSLEFNEYVLDNIQVLNNSQLIQNTVFAYDDLGGVNKRPFLKTITETKSNRVYSFEYFNTTNLPKYITKGLDHWGYWNGRDGNTSLSPFDTYDFTTGDYTLNNTFRDTEIQKHNVGMLSKIIYPTKGYSTFEYEPNFYGKRIERNSGSAFLPTLTNNAGVVGGARIHRQYDYSENGGIINDKTYKYTTTVNGAISSGILMNWPRYMYYIEYSGPGFIQKVMNRSSSNVQQNSLDSYNVGYQRVYEINSGKGYTEYNFTNYEDYPDILNPDSGNIRNYFIINPNMGTYQASPENLYKNFRNLYGIDRSILRGKLKSEIIYPESSANPLKKTEHIYNDNIDYNPNTSQDNNNYVTLNHQTGYWVQGYKRYLNTSAIKKKIVTDFLNNNPIATITDYSYNSSNHLNLTKENIVLSDNSELIKNYLYAQDSNSSNALMASKNMVGIPIIIEAKKDNKVISKSETIYPTSVPTAQTGTLVLPLSSKSFDLQSPASATTEVIYDQYDSKGNILQYTTKDGISTAIIWGYNGTQPIARIEGAKLSDIPQSAIDAIVSASVTDAQQGTPASDESLIAALHTFRTSLPAYQITTYSYDPLIGVRSITPPSGVREVYLYDTANRLKEIRQDSQTGKLLKEFKYHYKN